MTLLSRLVAARELARENLDYSCATQLTMEIRRLSGGSDMEPDSEQRERIRIEWESQT